MKIGYLKPVTCGKPQELYGEIKTLELNVQINCVPIPTKTKDTAPDYTIYAHDNIAIGAAWRKSKQQTGDTAFEFLSITIDDPCLSKALNVAAFQQENGTYEITWRRRQNSQKQNEVA